MGLFQFLMTNVENETKITRKVLAAVPNDKGDYTPDPTSMTALTLASHLATAEPWFANGVITGTFTAPEDGGQKFNSPSEVVASTTKKWLLRLPA